MRKRLNRLLPCGSIILCHIRGIGNLSIMLKSITIFVAGLMLASAAPTNVFEIDITPEEAQKYLNSPPFTEPQLSAKTNTLPLVRWNDPQFRSAEAGPTLGHYWKNGHEIENTQDYVEDVYDASQFHGQDGLGGYAYGYQAPESSKVENRARSGDVTGSYTYRDGNNELIKVRYWADSEGFHQEDNLPKVELKPIEETAEVREARVAHLKAWQEAADAAAQNPDPQGEYNDKYEYDSSASERKSVSVVAPGQGQAREGKQYYSQAQAQTYQSHQSQYQGQGPVEHAAASAQHSQGHSEEEAEPTGPPKGFFYSFNYPVSVIVAKNAQGEGQGPINPGQQIDHDTVGVNAYQRQG